jgi:hypothetical protein
MAFRGPIIPWRGPSPFHFVEVPETESREIEDVASLVTYGWGAIPATVHIGETAWTTSLFPRNGRYLVPLKDAVRKVEDLALGDTVDVELIIQLRRLPPPDR